MVTKEEIFESAVDDLDKKVKKPKIVETGKFGKDGWSISIGDVEDGDT